MAMTRIEAEDLILEKLKEIREIALAYSPEDKYLTLFFLGEHVSFCNGPAGKQAKRLDCWENIGDGEGPYHPELEEADDA